MPPRDCILLDLLQALRSQPAPAVSTAIAAFFLPAVGNYGFYVLFFFWAACTSFYFIVAVFFLPETRGKTLEEIEEFFQSPSRETVA